MPCQSRYCIRWYYHRADLVLPKKEGAAYITVGSQESVDGNITSILPLQSYRYHYNRIPKSLPLYAGRINANVVIQ